MDGSSPSEAGARLGLDLARRLGASVVLAHAMIEYVTEDDAQRVLTPSRKLAGEAILDQARARLGGVEVRTRMVEAAGRRTRSTMPLVTTGLA